MHRGRAVAALAVAAGLALSGCEVSGSVDIGPDSVTLDLTVIDDGPSAPDSGYNCPGQGGVFTVVERDTLPDGRQRCRFAATSLRSSDRSTPEGWGRQLVIWSDEHVFLNLPGFDPDGAASLDRVDIRVTAPGPVVVVAPGSVPFGTSVQITDPGVLANRGVTLVASRHPGLSAQGWWLLGGTIAGLATGGAAAWWWRRRRSRSDHPDAAGAPPEHLQAGITHPEQPSDQPTWSAEPGRSGDGGAP